MDAAATTTAVALLLPGSRINICFIQGPATAHDRRPPPSLFQLGFETCTRGWHNQWQDLPTIVLGGHNCQSTLDLIEQMGVDEARALVSRFLPPGLKLASVPASIPYPVKAPIDPVRHAVLNLYNEALLRAS